MGLGDLFKEQQDTVAKRFLKTLDRGCMLRSRRYTGPFKIKPSEFMGCKRKLYYKYKENIVEGTFPLKTRWGTTGTAIHEWFQRQLLMDLHMQEYIEIIDAPTIRNNIKDRDIKTEILDIDDPVEIKFKDNTYTKHDVSGMVDAIVEFENKLFIVEFKTAKDETYKEIINNGKMLDSHYTQGSLYSLILGLPLMFVVINKNTGMWESFDKYYTTGELLQTRDRIIELDNIMAGDEVPDKEESDNCKYCPAKAKCSKYVKPSKSVMEDLW
jgi:CRISPR/Cas system-associated exonuclease Cas4 (RecB family)